MQKSQLPSMWLEREREDSEEVRRNLTASSRSLSHSVGRREKRRRVDDEMRLLSFVIVRRMLRPPALGKDAIYTDISQNLPEISRPLEMMITLFGALSLNAPLGAVQLVSLPSLSLPSFNCGPKPLKPLCSSSSDVVVRRRKKSRRGANDKCLARSPLLTVRRSSVCLVARIYERRRQLK